ncbi:UDP-glycosyltransferase 83A1-like [Salvia miltiorrhiza]|uniref:UDP-glycosyltransferase 83A1-like n=1 Tax=Salvia miltiorrhiza TaxID=226208 RepID=UPI0025AD55A5|nr:UDP-glycosyltransferase 83A1-like [Salvia miltiorrhiza]
MNENMERPKEVGHILVVSSPLQGHATPLFKLSHRMAKLGMKVTFLTMGLPEAEAGADAESAEWNEGMRIISLHSGLQVGGGWEDQKKLHGRIHTVIPSYMEELLTKKTQSISGVIVDSALAWMLAIPKKMGLKTAVFWCSNAGCLALGFKIPHLLQSKYIDQDGSPLKEERIKLLADMPEMRESDLMWYFPTDKEIQKSMFHAIKGIVHHMAQADWIIGNWFHRLDPDATTVTPNVLPLGPILASADAAASSAQTLRAEDSSCLDWLDAQPPRSVVYVAFGSTARFSRRQLDELEAALEMSGRRFLWVAWSGLTEGPEPAYSEEFAGRVGDRGRMVEWAPQEAVLGHAATACFVTHCGWNSFTESLSNGVPVVCWPYFGDQMYTQRCACEGWKVGLRLEADEGGVVRRDEIRRRVEEIMEDQIVKENAMSFMGMGRQSIAKGGSSSNNLDYLLKQMNYPRIYSLYQ